MRKGENLLLMISKLCNGNWEREKEKGKNREDARQSKQARAGRRKVPLFALLK